LAPQQALDLLRSLTTVSSTIVEYVIASEPHEVDGDHIHAFIKYEKKVQFHKKKWDLTVEGKLYHGNYQPARSFAAVLAYCKKGGNYISNIDLQSAAQKKGKKNLQILTGDLKELVTEGVIHALQLPQAIKARSIFSLLGSSYQHHDVRGIWIYGPPGVGKSHYVRTLHPDCYVKPQHKWWEGYQGQEAVLLDDLDSPCLGHYLKIWADKWTCTGELKGSTVPLLHRVFYVTSNYHPAQLWPEQPHLEEDPNPAMLEAILRRFKIIHMLDKNLGLGKRSPLNNLTLPDSP